MQRWRRVYRALTELLPNGRGGWSVFCYAACALAALLATSHAEPQERGNGARQSQQASDAFDGDEIRKIIAQKLRRRLDEIPSSVVSVKAFGARGDGVSDDAAAIERAAASLRAGGVIVFPPGTYVQARSIVIKSRNILIWGSGARLHGPDPMNQALGLTGERSAVIGLTLTARSIVRATNLPQTRIVLAGRGMAAIDNVIDGGSAAGIMVYGGRDFWIEGNTVRNTLADAIHITGGAQAGVVVRNVVRASQDDMIAVVGYGKGHAPRNILIAHNDVAGNPWGRGIAIVGGRDITVRDNTIRDVIGGAGVLVAREAVWGTDGSSNVVIERNLLERIQTHGEVLAGRPRNGQGAIEIFSDGKGDRELAVHTLLIRDNEIRGAMAEGVRLIGNVCQIELVDNRFYEIGRAVLRTSDLSCAEATMSCRGNQHEGAPVSAPSCDTSVLSARGAAVQE
jgi:polygalacturonase